MEQNKEELLRYYSVIDKYGECRGTYERFESAWDLKEPTDEIRYYTGFETIYNVTVDFDKGSSLRIDKTLLG